MIAVVCYLWKGSRDFKPAHVDALARMVKKFLSLPHQFICVTDYPAGAFCELVTRCEIPIAAIKLLEHANPGGEKFPVSYPRLWTFSAEAQVLGDVVMLIDVDAIIVRQMAPLFTIDADFVGWRVRPAPGKPRRFGGGTWLLRTGTRTHVWDEFIKNPREAIALAVSHGYLGSDQAWISFKLSECEREWPEPSGIYCAQDYRKEWVRAVKARERIQQRRTTLPGWMKVKPLAEVPPLKLPADAIILHMNGEAKPWTSDDPIISRYWRPHYVERRSC